MGSVYFQEPSTDGAPGIWELEDALRFQALGKWPGLFTPAKFFANGETGASIQPRDTATIFQDSVGSLPVTASGQPCGLILDQHAWGGQTFAEMLAEQTPLLWDDFSEYADTAAMFAAGWIDAHTGAGITELANGRLVCLNVGSGLNTGGACYPIDVVAGHFYRIKFTLAVAAGGPGKRVGITNDTIRPGGGNLLNSTGTTTGTFTRFFRATETRTMYLHFFNQDSDGVRGEWDDISVIEIPGNHAIQATTAARPTYRDIGGVRYLESDGVDDALNITLPAGTYTRAYVTAAGVMTMDESVSIGEPEDIMRAPTVAGVLYIDRALTADEQARLAAYWGATL